MPFRAEARSYGIARTGVCGGDAMGYMNQVDSFHTIMRPWVYGVCILFVWLSGGLAYLTVENKITPQVGNILFNALGLLATLWSGIIGFGVPYSRLLRPILLKEPRRWRDAKLFWGMFQAMSVMIAVYLVASPFVGRIIRGYDFWP